jgi:type II secretory pathway predicted ATPase ExeA
MTVKAALAGSTIDEDDESEFLTTIRAHLSETSKSVVDRLAAVKDVYVECGRDTLLDVTFKTFVEFMLATRNGRRDDGRILFVTGESGAGKSAAVRRMLSSHPALQPIQVSFGFVRPVVSVSLSGPSTLRLVGEQIMAAARGYETVRKMRQGEIWKEMPADLRHRRVLIVHIDEPQHLMKDTETNLDRRNLANALKGVMNYAQWPVSFVLSGLPIVDEIARLDEQFERRNFRPTAERAHAG